MDLPRHELLAHATLTGDQHRRIHTRGALDQLANLPGCLARPQEATVDF